MALQRNSRDRRIQQRRGCRTGIKFPLTDSRGCIVPFDRSRIADRRNTSLPQRVLATRTGPNDRDSDWRRLEELDGMDAIVSGPDNERYFCIEGELIANVSNLYSSRSPGRWKELELYQTRDGQYLCLEIWRTAWDGKYDQYWLATCSDLRTARDFFGNNMLANELFEAAATEVIESGD